MSTSETKREILVYADWVGLGGPTLMGKLYSERIRGKEIFSFEYDKNWLQSEHAQVLDPDLQLYSGPQFLPDEKTNFGLFLDSSPDRWGRTLMRRREAFYARINDEKLKPLFETDFLLGVYDPSRMGALRYKLDPEGPFLDDNEFKASPPWSTIREMEAVTLRFEELTAAENPEYLKWLNMLIGPGSSLGGARPKASIEDDAGGLWIAKFPSKNDDMDVGGWEMVACELANLAGINMSTCIAKKYTTRFHTFLTKRFDRTDEGKRIHFASAMTLLGFTDGQDFKEGASYLDLVEFITTQGGNVAEDLEELWRRIVFSICVSNTDDHLRNHGFILTPHGWVLSPAYDINPVETGTGLSLNISENENSLELELAKEVSPYFRLDEKKAQKIMSEVVKAVSNWRKMADKYGISRREQELKSAAFSAAG